MKITFNNDASWKGGSLLPPNLKNCDNLSAWIKEFLQEALALKKRYVDSLANDGRLLGQEKANIVAKIDDLAGGLLIFREIIVKSEENMITSTNNQDFTFTIKILDNSWTGGGELQYLKELESCSFAELYNKHILENIRSLFSVYGQFLADKTITPEENLLLISKIDFIFSMFLRVERKIITTKL